MASIQETIGTPQWVIDNFIRIRDIFPPQKTQVTQQLMLHLGFKFKCAGVDWRSTNEMGQVMVLCQHLGLYTQEFRGEGVWIERSSLVMPPPTFFHMSPAQIQVNRILRAEPDAEARALAAEIIARVRQRALE